MPAARKLSIQDSITVLSPKGSKGLNAPIRLDRPAARIIAATSRTILLRLLLGGCRRFPQFYAITIRIHHPPKFAEVRFISLGIDFDALGAKLGQQPIQVLNAKVNHERFFAWLEVFRFFGKDRPSRGTIVESRIVAPMKHGAPAFGLNTQMSPIPRFQLLRIFRLEEDSADTCDSFHNCYLSCSRTSLRARSVYCRAICFRQFITKSVLSSGRALT